MKRHIARVTGMSCALVVVCSGCATNYLWENLGVREYAITGFTHAYASSNAVFLTYLLELEGKPAPVKYHSACVDTAIKDYHLIPDINSFSVDFNGHPETVWYSEISGHPSVVTSAPPGCIAVPIQTGMGGATSAVEMLEEHEAVVVDLLKQDDRGRRILVVKRAAELPEQSVVFDLFVPSHAGAHADTSYGPEPVTTKWRTPLCIALTPITVVVDVASVPVFIAGGVYVIVGIGTGYLDPN